MDEAVRFMSHGAGYDLFLTATETVLRVYEPRETGLHRRFRYVEFHRRRAQSPTTLSPEQAETFTVVLSSTNPETVGAPSTVFVTLLDRTTTPLLSITSVSVVEGNAGTTTDAIFTINLSAATGRSVTGNFATVNFGAL